MFKLRRRHGQTRNPVPFLPLAIQHVHAEQVDLTELSLEELLKVESIIRHPNTRSASVDAPSAVQVITREEIRLHGWRT